MECYVATVSIFPLFSYERRIVLAVTGVVVKCTIYSVKKNPAPSYSIARLSPATTCNNTHINGWPSARSRSCRWPQVCQGEERQRCCWLSDRPLHHGALYSWGVESGLSLRRRLIDHIFTSCHLLSPSCPSSSRRGSRCLSLISLLRCFAQRVPRYRWRKCCRKPPPWWWPPRPVSVPLLLQPRLMGRTSASWRIFRSCNRKEISLDYRNIFFSRLVLLTGLIPTASGSGLVRPLGTE